MQAGRRKEVSALPNAWSKDVGWSSRRKSLQAGSDFRRELHLALACIGFGGGVMAGNAAENVSERYWNIMQNLSDIDAKATNVYETCCRTGFQGPLGAAAAHMHLAVGQ